MKKLSLAILAVVTALTFCSCEGNKWSTSTYAETGPDGIAVIGTSAGQSPPPNIQ